MDKTEHADHPNSVKRNHILGYFFENVLTIRRILTTFSIEG
jgi:hypothetical protein